MCWHPEASSHNEGCPLSGGSQEEFDRGWCVALEGYVLLWYELMHYSASFQLGYRAGKAEINHLVDAAVERRFYDE